MKRPPGLAVAPMRAAALLAAVVGCGEPPPPQTPTVEGSPPVVEVAPTEREVLTEPEEPDDEPEEPAPLEVADEDPDLVDLPPTCATYIREFERCMETIVEPNVRRPMEEAMRAQRDAFREAAGSPEAWKVLEETCQLSLTAIRDAALCGGP